jgi:predicted secreted protein
MSNFIKGEVSILSVHDGTTYKPVACLTSNAIATDLSVIESTTKCNPGIMVRQPGMFSYSVTAEGQYIDTTTVGGDDAKRSHDALLAKQLTKTLVNFKLDTNVSNAESIKYFGSAVISSLSADFGSGDDLATFSLTLDGNGLVLLTDPLV